MCWVNSRFAARCRSETHLLKSRWRGLDKRNQALCSLGSRELLAIGGPLVRMQCRASSLKARRAPGKTHRNPKIVAKGLPPPIRLTDTYARLHGMRAWRLPISAHCFRHHGTRSGRRGNSDSPGPDPQPMPYTPWRQGPPTFELIPQSMDPSPTGRGQRVGQEALWVAFLRSALIGVHLWP